MKIILTVALTCILAGDAFAQTFPIKYGIKAGVSLAKIALSGNDYGNMPTFTNKSTPITSFHFTGLVEVPVSNSFSVQPGLSLTSKGSAFMLFKSGTEQGLDYLIRSNSTANIIYLELPVNAFYKTDDGFYFGAGPYAAYAIAGQLRSEGTNKTGGLPVLIVYEDRNIKFGTDEDKDDFKAVDFGLNFSAGYQLKMGINIGINYGLGLTNLTPKGTAANKQSNGVTSFSAGFMFSQIFTSLKKPEPL